MLHLKAEAGVRLAPLCGPQDMLLSDLPPSPAALRFGRFELQTTERQLLIDGRPALLGARAFDLLVALVERPGELVRKHELLERVWPGQVVEENNIAVQVNALRKLLGGEAIGTVPGRGYRFTARLDGMAVAALATPAPLSALQTHLPRALPTLQGRGNDLAALGALIDGHPLVTVTGAGGVGKTLLVQHLLDARRRVYRHGVCWVELASVADEAALPATLAAALGVPLGGGDALDALALAVGPLDLLLALDNAEHLASDVGRLATRLIDSAPDLKLVVTSQVPLGVAAERVLRLAVLDVPPPGASVEQARASGAVALFVDRAQAAGARFALTDANVSAVVALCRSLDGLALAIELAAARTPILGIHGLACSMGDRLQLLTRNRNHEAPARQRTLRAALEWRHGFLDGAAQRPALIVLLFPEALDDAVRVRRHSRQVAEHATVDQRGGEDLPGAGLRRRFRLRALAPLAPRQRHGRQDRQQQGAELLGP